MPDGKLDLKLLQQLIDAFGVSGSEEEIREIIRKAVKPYVDEVFIDNMGNLIARKRGKKPRVMVAAHMDEVGLMVKRIEERGFIHCAALGDLDTITIIGQTVHIKTKKGSVHGVITTKEFSAAKLTREIPKMEDIIVDTGLSKKQLEDMGITIGTYLPIEHSSCCLGQDGTVFGKALDDRLGCFVLIETAKRLARQKKSAEIYYVFTVQEEIGLRGATSPAFTIHPDYGIVVDATHANDTFDEPSRFVGKGPCITIKDGSFIGNKCINGWLENIAKKKKVPYQLEAIDEGTTDAAMIQTTAGGVPSSVLSIPVRNMHTIIGVASIHDLEGAITILEELLRDPPLQCIV